MKLTDRKRQAILDAAIAEFAEHGFEAARISRIGKLAEVSSRTLYRHFESKEALFDAIVDIQVARLEMPTSSEYDPGLPLRDQLIEVLTAYVDAMTAEDFMVLTRITHPVFLRDTSLAQRGFSKFSPQDHIVVRLIEQAMDAGALRKEDHVYAAKQAAFMLLGFFYWPTLILGEAESVPKSRSEVIADCADMFLSYYRPGS